MNRVSRECIARGAGQQSFRVPPASDRVMTKMPASFARARVAVGVMFFVNGLVLASWVPHIPAVKRWHAIGDGRLGAVLLAMAVGAVVALPFAGWLVGRFGSRRMTTVAALALCATLPLP